MPGRPNRVGADERAERAKNHQPKKRQKKDGSGKTGQNAARAKTGNDSDTEKDPTYEPNKDDMEDDGEDFDPLAAFKPPPGSVAVLPALYKDILLNSMKEECWRRVQFVGNSTMLMELTSMWLTYCGRGVFTDPKGNVKQEYVYNYADVCRKELNKLRSDTVSKIKDVCNIYWTENDKKLPSISALEMIVRRDPKVDRELFVWWWSELMPKLPGKGTTWTQERFTNYTLSDCKDGNTTCYITPGLEAFALLTIENNHEKWPISYEFKLHDKAKIVPVKKIIPGRHVDIPGVKKYMSWTENPKLKPKYTEQGAGRVEFGGYKGTGLSRYLKLRAECKAARKKSGALEDEILQKVKEVFKNQTNDAKPSAKKKAARVPVDEKTAAGLGWQSDSSSNSGKSET